MPGVQIEQIARFPSEGDNAVIALSDLTKGTVVENGSNSSELEHDVLCGHRFAAQPITEGEFITSWSFPFGKAVRDISAGEYLCNQNVLFRLSIQEDAKYSSLDIPAEPNFNDDIPPFVFDETAWTKPPPVNRHENVESFLGFDRGERGVGTRNHLVVLSTSSSTSPLVKRLEADFEDSTKELASIDSIVGLIHTEGEEDNDEERERTLRTLAGMLANPNVGGFLAIESGKTNEISNQDLQHWMEQNQIPEMRCRFLTASDSVESDLSTAAQHIDALWSELSEDVRSPQPLSALKIGLQCGASDAFSGISGNVLSGAIAREIIKHGGSANLTETPELSGAEDYTLESISSPKIGHRFLGMLNRFKQQLGWHGGKVDKNPSEGNLLGGLYNITLKSLGAAVKRDPEIPIDHIVEYSERMSAPGYYFMDGMGGDIASYTGQAASGCNIILFVTGRGTPTNSSIVPTIKIVNTTERYHMMSGDIDVNAGQYLDGQSMNALTEECMSQIGRISSGERTKGEKRKQNIDLIWRRRFFQADDDKSQENHPSRLPGTPSPFSPERNKSIADSDPFTTEYGKVALIIPTVGCSIATAEQAAAHLNQSALVESGQVDRFVVLPNTEGCGVTTGSEVLNFLLSYSSHQRVKACLFLSLGCEMVSSGFIKSAMNGSDVGFPEISAAAKRNGLSPAAHGWITIQDCGGTENSINKIQSWFESKLGKDLESDSQKHSSIRIGIMQSGPISGSLQRVQENLTEEVFTQGGSIVFNQTEQPPTLCFAQPIEKPGLHFMESITNNKLEAVTGLGAATDLILHFSSNETVPSNRLVPTLNITADSGSPDFDIRLQAFDESQWKQKLSDLIRQTLKGNYQSRQALLGQYACQIPRGARAHAI